MSHKHRIATALTFFLFAGNASAATHFVAPDASGDYATIQAAVNASANGDTILLGSGTFSGAGNIDVDSQSKSLFVISVAGAAQTNIDCAWSGRAFYIHDSAQPLTISGIHVKRGRAYGGRGGAILAENTTVTVVECEFTMCLACDGGAIALIGSVADVVRCRFDRNNCIWTDCVGIGGAGCTDTSRGTVFCESSTVSVIDGYFEGNAVAWDFGHGLGLYAIDSYLELVGNRFFQNRFFEGEATVDLVDCQLEVAGNELVGNRSWKASGIRIVNCQGSVRGNLVEANLGQLGPSGVSLENSTAAISFNYFRRNVGSSIETTWSTSDITRNLIIETTSSCCWAGSGIYGWGCDSQRISNNTLYQNGDPNYIREGHEMTYQNPAATIEGNILLSDSSEPFNNCDYFSDPCDNILSRSPQFVDLRNVQWGGFGAFDNQCNLQVDWFDPLLRDPASGNFFLRPESQCYTDTIIGNFVIEVFQGALPKGSRPASVVGVSLPASGHSIAMAGELHELTGFSLTNDSPVDAVINYRLLVTGGELADMGDARSFVGSSPVLAPAETFTPPPAAIIVPPGQATVKVKYCYAYAPALNLVDTMTTTVDFGQPLSTRVSSFEARFDRAGVRLRWVAVTDNLIGWYVYRSANGNEWRRITNSTLPASAHEYVDAGANAGQRYKYRLVALADEETIASEIEITPSVQLSLGNSPNPFNPNTTIHFSIPATTEVALEIFAVDGSRVRTLHDGLLPGGFHNRAWDGRDDGQREVSSGVYFCRLIAGSERLTRKLVLAR